MEFLHQHKQRLRQIWELFYHLSLFDGFRFSVIFSFSLSYQLLTLLWVCCRFNRPIYLFILILYGLKIMFLIIILNEFLFVHNRYFHSVVLRSIFLHHLLRMKFWLGFPFLLPHLLKRFEKTNVAYISCFSLRNLMLLFRFLFLLMYLMYLCTSCSWT